MGDWRELPDALRAIELLKVVILATLAAGITILVLMTSLNSVQDMLMRLMLNS